MAISFTCSQCGKKYSLDDKLAGRKGKCGCGQTIVVPRSDSKDPGVSIKQSPSNESLNKRNRQIVLILGLVGGLIIIGMTLVVGIVVGLTFNSPLTEQVEKSSPPSIPQKAPADVERKVAADGGPSKKQMEWWDRIEEYQDRSFRGKLSFWEVKQLLGESSFEMQSDHGTFHRWSELPEISGYTGPNAKAECTEGWDGKARGLVVADRFVRKWRPWNDGKASQPAPKQ